MKKLDTPTPPTISIVIPVYNEADTIAACLTAIARQTVQPLEVIVVDNNSTDDTAALAKRYPFVRVLHEPKQGVVYARTTGFNAAHGDIIGRIDADTVIAADWVRALQTIFASVQVQAVSGRASYADILCKGLFTTSELVFRRWLARRMRSMLFLYGANMAVRRSAWETVAASICTDEGLHEDLDVAIHLGEAFPGGVAFDERLRAEVSTRRLASGFTTVRQYALANPRTYARHSRREGRFMYPIALFMIVLYPLLGVMHRAHNANTSRTTMPKRFGGAARVNPATFRD